MTPTAKQPSPIALVMLSIVSIQFGAALAKSLFSELGPWGVVFLRVSVSALVLFIFWRPRWHSDVRQNFGSIAAFGAILALMNSFFYLAIARLPLGIAIALEFTGPLGLSLLKSQRWLDALWAILAGTGIVLLAPIGGFTLDRLGVFAALAAGLCWALYILLAARVGQRLAGIDGLAWALAIGAVLLLPVGVASAGTKLLNPTLLALGAGVALLSTTLPYTCELVALRSLPVKVFGVMLSMEPTAGAIAGFFILGETLSARAMIACLLVSIAAAGATQFQSQPPASPLP